MANSGDGVHRPPEGLCCGFMTYTQDQHGLSMEAWLLMPLAVTHHSLAVEGCPT